MVRSFIQILSVLIPVTFGLALTIPLSFITPLILRSITRRFEEEAKDLPRTQRWVGSAPPGGRTAFLIGLLETTLFFFTIFFQAGEIIAAYFVFKLGTKWEVWHNIVKVPSRKEETGVIPVRARNIWGARVHQRFLIGTLLNLLWAFIGAGLAIGIRILFFAQIRGM